MHSLKITYIQVLLIKSNSQAQYFPCQRQYVYVKPKCLVPMACLRIMTI